MGLGDEIMALGEAERVFLETGRPVRIIDRYAKSREHPAWAGNPAWDKHAQDFIQNGAGVRPYIQKWVGNRIIFNHQYRPRAGLIALGPDDYATCQAQGEFVIVAPNLKKEASVNKDWGFEKWQEVVNGLELPVYQLMGGDEPILENVIPVSTPSFRAACAWIKKAKLVLCNEGGTHHMAASMGTKAVVIFGAFVPPSVTGYPIHCNITTKDAHYCGNFSYCAECQNALAKITPDVVLSKARGFLRGVDESGIYRV